MLIARLSKGVGVIADLHGETFYLFIAGLGNLDPVQVEQRAAFEPVDSQLVISPVLVPTPTRIKDGDDVNGPV